MVVRRLPVHGPGGLQSHADQLTRRLAGIGIEVDLVSETPRSPGAAARAAAGYPPGVTVQWIPGGWLPLGRRPGTVVLDRVTNYPAWAIRVGRWLRDAPRLRDARRPTGGTAGGEPRRGSGRRWPVVHVHGLAGLGLARQRAAGHLEAPLLLSPHGLEEFQVPGGPKRWAYAPFRAWMRQIARRSDRVVAMDRSLQPLIRRHLEVPDERQVTIPNAVDVKIAGDAENDAGRDRGVGRALVERLGLERARPLLLSVGRIAPNKGFELLAAALGQVADELPAGWGWVVVGDGPRRSALESAVATAGIADRTALAGVVDQPQLDGLYAVADWFVHPTLYEGSSIVTLEAMAHGLPVIATRAGGLPDKVEEGETGFLVAPGEVGALAEALRRIGSVDAAAMGARGRRRCRAEFSWDVVVGRYAELYREMARDRPPDRVV